MISQKLCEEMWQAYREIDVSETMLDDMSKELAKHSEPDRSMPRLKDAFGYRKQIQMGVPSGSNCHRLFDVAPDLAKSVIKAHIANKKALLTELNERVKMEIFSPIPARRVKLMVDGVPRRSRVDLLTGPEDAIRFAIQTVEGAGSHELLTEAVVKLQTAYDLVADFVELSKAETPNP